ncbi:MAG: endonuclease domain-containing protein [Candidatus Marinimicrobia bacterium]|nr:endonuclease domain-containing protein [Candidatus Neomarinimicrobiota bacterium]
MNIDVTEICRKNRTNGTLAENTFWKGVRNRQILGIKFNRQFSIFFEYEGENRFFITDFYCHEHKLIIEIDGGIHETQKDYDILRSYILNQLGYTIIRFANEEILDDLTGSITRLKTYFQSQKTKNSPSILREGVRG